LEKKIKQDGGVKPPPQRHSPQGTQRAQRNPKYEEKDKRASEGGRYKCEAIASPLKGVSYRRICIEPPEYR
jgi:hypothetical protein